MKERRKQTKKKKKQYQHIHPENELQKFSKKERKKKVILSTNLKDGGNLS
jgi:hypothetical protein